MKVTDEKIFELMYLCNKLEGRVENPNFSDRQFVIRIKELFNQK